MTNYEVAVMNYPLFYQNTPEDASIRLLSPPFHTDEGGPWETSMYIHIPFAEAFVISACIIGCSLRAIRKSWRHSSTP